MTMNSHFNIAHFESAAGIIQGDLRSELINLGPGYLDPSLVPIELIAQWSADALRRWGPHALAYGANGGPWELRAKFAARAPAAGVRRGPENVLVTGGTSAAVDQLAVRFAREGRILLTEALTYDLARMIFVGRGVRTVAVPGPLDDIDVDQFRKAAARAVRSSGVAPAIYVIPTFHNPTGRFLSAQRRREILAMARETGALVVEDLAYAELGYESPPPPSLWDSAADPEQVISLYSLAKCLAPGMRLGWIVGGERPVAELAQSPVRVSGGGPNHFASMVVMAGLVNDEFGSHVSSLRDELRSRRDTLVAALMTLLPESFAVSQPAGGFFVWVGLPAGVSDHDLLRAAECLGVSFAAGSRFGASSGGVRLCFAGYPPEQLAEGAARFADAARSA
jgi:DNA-binding transcriptional MocR family regulator